MNKVGVGSNDRSYRLSDYRRNRSNSRRAIPLPTDQPIERQSIRPSLTIFAHMLAAWVSAQIEPTSHHHNHHHAFRGSDLWQERPVDTLTKKVYAHWWCLGEWEYRRGAATETGREKKTIHGRPKASLAGGEWRALSGRIVMNIWCLHTYIAYIRRVWYTNDDDDGCCSMNWECEHQISIRQ